MNDNVGLSDVCRQFESKHIGSYQVVKSPGRINIIGEHLDYHEGFVMPAAVDKAVYFAFKVNDAKTCNFSALNLNDEFSHQLGRERSLPNVIWQKYVLAILYQLQDEGYEIGGISCVFGGNVPVGAGMSSSAALTCGLMAMWNESFDLGLDKKTIVLLAQKAEHRYVGVLCGIMDQFANTFGEAKTILKLDCRDLTYELIPFDEPQYCFLLLNTGVKHTHAGGAYNSIRKQCEDTIPVFQKLDSNVKSLRQVSNDMLEQVKSEISPGSQLKIRFVIKEIKRVHQAANYMRTGMLDDLGQLLYETHYGLKNEYGVSCEELDFLVDASKEITDVLGARMMGGGFGGCTINLVPKTLAEEIGMLLLNKYKLKYKYPSAYYIANISDGTHLLT